MQVQITLEVSAENEALDDNTSQTILNDIKRYFELKNCYGNISINETTFGDFEVINIEEI